jgi:hypothetical protein
VVLRPNADHGFLILEVSRSHTTKHHSRQDSSGLAISSSQSPLPNNTQHSQQTNIHATAGIRTHNLNRGAAADLRHWEWLVAPFTKVKYDIYLDCHYTNFPTVPVATFVTLVVKLSDTPVVVMVTRKHRKCFAVLVFSILLLIHYDQIGFTAISNPCRLSTKYCVRQFEPV